MSMSLLFRVPSQIRQPNKEGMAYLVRRQIEACSREVLEVIG